MRCSRHHKVRCTYPTCIREVAASAVDGPSVDDYPGNDYISPGTYSFTPDDTLSVQIAPFVEPDTSPNYELEDH